MVAPAHDLFDAFRRRAHMRRVAVLVRKGLLLGKDDGNGRNALAVSVADRRGDAGDRVIRLSRKLHRPFFYEVFHGA